MSIVAERPDLIKGIITEFTLFLCQAEHSPARVHFPPVDGLVKINQVKARTGQAVTVGREDDALGSARMPFEAAEFLTRGHFPQADCRNMLSRGQQAPTGRKGDGAGSIEIPFQFADSPAGGHLPEARFCVSARSQCFAVGEKAKREDVASASGHFANQFAGGHLPQVDSLCVMKSNADDDGFNQPQSTERHQRHDSPVKIALGRVACNQRIDPAQEHAQSEDEGEVQEPELQHGTKATIQP